eukprot:TRINITY_DN14574_c0_g1_i10.p1 TRINITY_DN14574_c0_g1~~TRINITY_DN14574_c0_g1_i10.p1  ORF type:complete len:244 (-),score=60.71 TRINITY_DN14574_c0_g1_i10:1049-1780(-)
MEVHDRVDAQVTFELSHILYSGGKESSRWISILTYSLQTLNSIATIEELIADMEKDYNSICKAAPEFEKIASLKDFMETRALVNSRIFGARIDGEEEDSIVPYADMFNYKYRNEMTLWNFASESNSFVIKAKCDICAGEEIFVHYGNKPNSSFFQFYGFVVDNNENNEVSLQVSLQPEDKLKAQKTAMMQKKEAKRKFKLTEKTDDEQFEQLMSYLRFIVFDGSAEELENVKFIMMAVVQRWI